MPVKEKQSCVIFSFPDNCIRSKIGPCKHTKKRRESLVLQKEFTPRLYTFMLTSVFHQDIQFLQPFSEELFKLVFQSFRASSSFFPAPCTSIKLSESPLGLQGEPSSCQERESSVINLRKTKYWPKWMNYWTVQKQAKQWAIIWFTLIPHWRHREGRMYNIYNMTLE